MKRTLMVVAAGALGLLVSPGVAQASTDPCIGEDGVVKVQMGRQRRWQLAFVLVFAVQCLALYRPSTPPEGPAGLPWDKLIHVGLFAVVSAIGVRAGAGGRLVLILMIGQAFISEFIQGLLLPARSASAADLFADAVGIAVGLALGSWWVRGADYRRSGVSPADSVTR